MGREHACACAPAAWRRAIGDMSTESCELNAELGMSPLVALGGPKSRPDGVGCCGGVPGRGNLGRL